MRGNPGEIRAGAIGAAEGTGFNDVTIELFDTFEGAAVTCTEDNLLICVGEGLEIVADAKLLLATCGGDEEMVLTVVFGSEGLVR